MVHFHCCSCGRVHAPEPGECPPSDCAAVVVCLDDALLEASRGDLQLHLEAAEMLGALATQGARPLWEWESEGRTQADVLRLFDVALARAEAMRRTAVQTFAQQGEQP